MPLDSMVESPAIRLLTLVKATRSINEEELNALKAAVGVIEELTDELCFGHADIFRQELHWIADSMQSEIDRLEGF